MRSSRDLIAPAEDRELAAAVAEAAAKGTPLEVAGGGSRRDLGRPIQTAGFVTTENLRGITLYEPTELVLSARSGTPLAEIEAALARNDQHLAFEPIDLGPALGGREGQGTVGSVFATNFGGSRRATNGAPRDHLLGLTAVNGRGELIRSGGRVMKNVTGYDLCKAVAGSWGTLAVMTEVTMKVLPRPESSRTIVCFGLPDHVAVEVMSEALTSPYEVTGAVHLHAIFARGFSDEEIGASKQAVTAIRIENFDAAARYRVVRLADRLAAFAPKLQLEDERSRAFWREMQTLRFVAGTPATVWRITTAPQRAPRLVAAIAKTLPCRVVYDWGGALIWLACEAISDAGSLEVRRSVAEHGGNATLIRAAAPVRASLDVFQPLDATIADLTRRVKAAFDPAGILNPGRMYAGL